jgi:hypothetical protein
MLALATVAGCEPSRLDALIGRSGGMGAAATADDARANEEDSARMGPRLRQRACGLFFLDLRRIYGSSRLTDAQLADLAAANGLRCHTTAPGRQTCAAIRRVPLTSTMSWWGPHDVAGRASIIVEPTRTPGDLNDITGFDVRLAD